MDLYKQHKENLMLQRKIEEAKKEQRLFKLKRQLSDMNSTYKEVTDGLETISGNIKFLNKEMNKVHNVINHENKVQMKTEDADALKDLQKSVLTVALKEDDVITGVDNLNKLKENILNNALINADYNQRSCQSNKELIDNIKEIIDGNSDGHNEETVTVASSMNTHLFLESELVSSSPMPTISTKVLSSTNSKIETIKK